LFGHLQPFAQSSQQAHSHAQFGQSLQQSSEQHAAAVLLLQQETLAASSFEAPAMPAATRAPATARPPNNFVNMNNSLSMWIQTHACAWRLLWN
jgi:hypothetical protein